MDLIALGAFANCKNAGPKNLVIPNNIFLENSDEIIRISEKYK